MKIIAEWDTSRMRRGELPLLSLYIHDAPHRRMGSKHPGAHEAIIQDYREHMKVACRAAGMQMPYEGNIDLSVLYINPSSPDHDNLLVALFQALDGKTLKGGGVLTDDSHVQTLVRIGKYFNKAP